MISHNKTILEALGRPPVHPFPARMAPGIALDILKEYKKPIRVLDPMMGSGTVLAVAKSQGHRAFGVDSDPLAVLLSTVWTHSIDKKSAVIQAEDVLNRALHQSSKQDISNISDDPETQAFIHFWFDPIARRELFALAVQIATTKDTAIRNVLWCAFSRLIISKSSGASLAMDLSHSRPHKAFQKAPISPFAKFTSAVNAVTSNCPQKGRDKVGPVCTTKLGDARNLKFADKTMDVILTSPPYLNAIDYLRCSKFSLVWMGYTIAQIRAIRRENIGSETTGPEDDDEAVMEVTKGLKLQPELQTNRMRMLFHYIKDMKMAIFEAARVLRTNGQAIYVVGDSSVNGTFVQNSQIVQALAKISGMKLTSRRSRNLPANRRYLPPPSGNSDGVSQNMNTRMRKEIIMVFKNAAA